MDRSLLDLLPEAVVVLDADGRILQVNHRAGPLLGLRPAVISRPVGEVLALRHLDGTAFPLPPAPFDPGWGTDDLRLEVVRPDGTVRPLALAVRRSGTTTVLTARSAAGQQHRERAASQVVSLASHELRSPLASVKGFTRTLLTRWDRFSDEQRLAMLETIDHDADRITGLLVDLLEASRIAAGQLRLQREPVDLTAIAAEVVDRAGARPDLAGRALRLSVAGEVPTVQADRARLELALGKLVDNAIVHGRSGDVDVEVAGMLPDGAEHADAAGVLPDGGEHADAPEVDAVGVAVSTAGAGGPHTGAPPADAPAQIVTITVRDAGPGLPPGSGSPGMRGRPRGLGLRIARGVVEAHGGRLDLVSPPPGSDTGTLARIVLPAGEVP